MSLLQELKDLEARHWMIAVVTALVVIGPGFLCIYQFRPDLFTSFDVIKLVVWSGSMTLPLAAFNFVAAALALEKTDDDLQFDAVWTLAAMVTSIVLYLALLVSYWSRTPFRGFVAAAGGIEAVFCAAFALIYLKASWTARRKHRT